jgi:ABC-type nitrate/sulfonate/bicarbonate transport system permease component
VTKWKIDRTTIFLCLVFILFLWDLAYFLGIRNPARFPHPFVIFRTLGDIEFLRGLPGMLRQIIFSLVSGWVLGVAIGSLVLYNSWLSEATIRFLRIGLWLPFLVIFAVPETFWLGIAAVTLCSCYHFLAGRSLLGLQGNELRRYVAREATLQALFISLISQIWVQRWMWFIFAWPRNPAMGFGVLAVLVVFLGFVNWVFRSNFDVIAEKGSTVLSKELSGAGWQSFLGVLLLTVACLATWQLFSAARFNFLHSSLLEALKAAYYLFMSGEIWGDIGRSLLELVGGIVLGGSIALVVFALLSTTMTFRNFLFLLLPLTHIAPIVLWLLVWVTWIVGLQDFLVLWHKVIAVGCLTFFPFVQGLWGLRVCPLLYRVLMAMDNSLPIAFVTMCFGELYAATAGLGFMMTVASATGQTDKRLAGFLITLVLLVTLSSTLRWVVKRLYLSESNSRALPV